MVSLCTDVALRKTLEDFCEARDKVRGLIESGYRALDLAECECNEQAHHCFPYDAHPRGSLQDSLKSLDANFWRKFLEYTGVTALFDAKALNEFRDQIAKHKSPPFTIDNIDATYAEFYQNREAMFARGVYEVFRKLDRKAWKTNDRERFRLGPKLVLEFWFSPRWRSGGLEVRYGVRDGEMNDIDRVFRMLGGIKYTAGALRDALNAHFVDQHATPFENELFKIRGFLNGNAHVWFKRLDLLDKVNETIGEYCDGRAVPDARPGAYAHG